MNSAPSSTLSKTLRDDPEMAKTLQHAIDLNRDGRSAEAARVLEKVVEHNPTHPAPWWYLGGIYRVELKRPLEALACYQKAVEAGPKSERASLGLFHTLWELDRFDDALEEIKRFQLLTNWSCEDYLKIMDEIKEKWLDSPKSTKKAKTKR